MPSRCRYCKKEASVTRPLFQCLSCGRSYHSACHIPHPTRSNDWACHRCIVDSQEAARRHHYHARSSFSLRSASSTTSLRLSTTSTVGLPGRPCSAMGYSVSSSSTDNTRLIPCSIPQCEAPSVNIFCAQHLKSFPVPLPVDLAPSTSQKPDAAATSSSSSIQPLSNSHSVDGQVGAGKPANIHSEAEIANVARQSPQGCTPNPLETRPVRNRSAPFPTTKSKLLPGNIVRRKTAGKDPYLNGRTPKPGPGTHRGSTSLAQNSNSMSTGSSSARPKALSSTNANSFSPPLTTNISSQSVLNGGPRNKSSSLSPSSNSIDRSRVDDSETRDKARSKAKSQESTQPANMAIDAPFLSAEKQSLGERQNGPTQPSDPGHPPRRIAEIARQFRFSDEMQDATCSGSAMHAPQQPRNGPTPAQNQAPQNKLPLGTHQQNSSGGISNLQVIMPTGQSSNYMSMSDRLAVHYARSAFDLAGYNPPAGLIRGSMPTHTPGNGTESNIAEPRPDLCGPDLLHGSRFPNNSDQTVGQPRPLPPQRPQQPQPRPRLIVTNIHDPIVISDSDSDSDSGGHSEPQLQAESTHPPEPAPDPQPAQQQPQAKRTESQQRQESQQGEPAREPVPPDTDAEPVPEPVSKAQPIPKLIPQPVAKPTPQLSPRKQANPLPKKVPTPVEQPTPTESLLPHTTPTVSTYEESLLSASAAAAAGAVVTATLPAVPTKPPQPHVPDEPVFAHIDPRIHWPQRHSEEWFEAKQKEIQARGKRKANFGKAARSMHRQRVTEGPPETLEETLPDKVLDNPAWVDMLKRLQDMKPATGKEKGNESTGTAIVTTATATTTGTTTKGRRTGGGLKRTFSTASAGTTNNGGESEAGDAADKAITTPKPKRRAAGAGL
ncbi:hypothetical protein QBC45DRAFT_322820 [Copromyces sp. CBS 386.78]|nr:hypothetical protein QBC45DRAFT_322820 [Copromyces sp. CBS 386.78]